MGHREKGWDCMPDYRLVGWHVVRSGKYVDMSDDLEKLVQDAKEQLLIHWSITDTRTGEIVKTGAIL